MPVTISVTGANAEEALKEVQEFFKPKDESLDALLERVKGLLAAQGMTVSVTGVETNGGSEPVSEDVSEEPEEKPKRKRGGQPKLTPEEAAAALAATTDVTETSAARKARCVAKLQEMFAAGRKSEVRDILAKHGEGAKSFHAVAEGSFGPISDALEKLEA
jgi:hypothetical protein